mgnify:CR=1 FL=1
MSTTKRHSVSQRLDLALWSKVGDGEYENHGTDFSALAEALYVSSIQSDDVLWLSTPRNPTNKKNYKHYLPRAGFVTLFYDGDNYVSLYWGDKDGNLVQPLTLQDRDDLLTRLRKLEQIS